MAEVNRDLSVERETATFNVSTLTNLLDGNVRKTARRRYIQNLAASDREFDGPGFSFLSTEEKYDEVIRKYMLVLSRRNKYRLGDPEDMDHFIKFVDGDRNMIHPSVLWQGFVQPRSFETSNLYLQGTDEQIARWRRQIESGEYILSYSLSEIGHGSFVRGIETTATYDPGAREFVLNTPNITATKWCIMGLGKTANFTYLSAQLITKGKKEGVCLFMVQVRDLQTHQPLPGITIGECGPKFGYHEIDHGYLRLENVRIPRDQMLMRHAQILEDGTFVPPSNPKAVYAGVLEVRTYLPLQHAINLGKSVTIATRYSCVRRQSELIPHAPEAKILDYQTQQDKLFPLIARAYAFWFTARFLRQEYKAFREEIKHENYQKLKELHALGAGLKAVCTARCSEGVEICRQACGGHGYSEASGLPKLYTYRAAQLTADGDNTVLLLQTARYLFKCATLIRKGKCLDPSSQYLSGVNLRTAQFGEQMNLDNLLDAYRIRSALSLDTAVTKYETSIRDGLEEFEAKNSSSVLSCEAASVHCDVIVLQCFVKTVERPDIPETDRSVLCQLCELHAIRGLVLNPTALIQHGYMSSTQLDWLNKRRFALYDELRPNAVPLVDAFDFPDRLLGSVLGRYDGNVYANLYNWARESEMNKSNVHPTFPQYIKPFRELMLVKSNI